jgi:hypothetical protein
VKYWMTGFVGGEGKRHFVELSCSFPDFSSVDPVDSSGSLFCFCARVAKAELAPCVNCNLMLTSLKPLIKRNRWYVVPSSFWLAGSQPYPQFV